MSVRSRRMYGVHDHGTCCACLPDLAGTSPAAQHRNPTFNNSGGGGQRTDRLHGSNVARWIEGRQTSLACPEDRCSPCLPLCNDGRKSYLGCRACCVVVARKAASSRAISTVCIRLTGNQPGCGLPAEMEVVHVSKELDFRKVVHQPTYRRGDNSKLRAVILAGIKPDRPTHMARGLQM